MAGTDVLLGKTSGLPYDIQTEQARLAKRRKIADALMLQSLTGGQLQHAGTGQVFADWGTPLGNIAKAWAGKSIADETDQGERAVSADYNKRLAEGIKNYVGSREGGFDRPLSDANGTPLQDTRSLDDTAASVAPQAFGYEKGDKVKAVANALGSGIQPLQQMAMADWANQNKGRLTPEDRMKYIKDYGVTPGGPSEQFLREEGLIPPADVVKSENAYVTVGKGGNQTGGPAPIQTFGPVAAQGPSGVPAQTSLVTGETKGIQGGNTTPQADREKALAAADVEQLKLGREEYRGAITGLGNVTRMERQIATIDPSKFGSAADFRNGANKVLEFFGGKPQPATATMEQIHAGLGNVLLEKIRALAPVTKEDVAEMQRIVGTEGNTQRALQAILAIAKQSYLRKMEQHEQFVSGFAKMPGVDAGFRERWLPSMTNSGMAPGESVPTAPGSRDWDKYKG